MSDLISLRHLLFENMAHVWSFLYFAFVFFSVFVFVCVFVFVFVLVFFFVIIIRMSYLASLRPRLFKNIAHVGSYLYFFFVFVFVCVFVFVFLGQVMAGVVSFHKIYGLIG